MRGVLYCDPGGSSQGTLLDRSTGGSSVNIRPFTFCSWSADDRSIDALSLLPRLPLTFSGVVICTAPYVLGIFYCYQGRLPFTLHFVLAGDQVDPMNYQISVYIYLLPLPGSILLYTMHLPARLSLVFLAALFLGTHPVRGEQRFSPPAPFRAPTAECKRSQARVMDATYDCSFG